MNKTLLEEKDFEQQKAAEDTKSAKRSVILFLICTFILGINTFHIKLTSKLFPESFSPNSFMAWRSVCVVLMAVYISKRYSIPVKPINEINNKCWFIQRTCGNYVSFFFFLSSMLHLRAATAACFNSMYPPFVLILSIIILKEKFHVRYLVGLLLCVCGAIIIVSNERPHHSIPAIDDTTDIALEAVIPHDSTKQDDYLSLIKGISCASIGLLFISLNLVANKIIGKELTHTEQCYYLGLTNLTLGFSITIMTEGVKADPFYILSAFLNGFIFYIATYLMNEAFKGIELSKLTPMSYFNTLTVFFLGVVFLGESIYLTDIIGSLCIISFNIYNAFVPIK
jgi:drug/metabolite transporter (DMT)-like permease